VILKKVIQGQMKNY